jgi:DNA-binding SARP family transcriptional activator
LHRLARALPPHEPGAPWVITRGATVGWNPAAPVWTDVGEFERTAADEGRIDEAVAVYSGDLLAPFDEEWIEPQRERFRTTYLRLLTALAQHARRAGMFEKTVEYAQEMLRADPWSEEAIRWLMGARYELGDRAGALAEYDAFRQRLRADLGTVPSAETVALESVIRSSASLATTPPDGSEAAPRDEALPFLGRDRVIEAVLRTWNHALAGNGESLLVGGEAGIGKSRLAREIAVRVQSSGARVLFGATSAREAQPYQPVVEALRTALPSLLALDIEPLWLGVLTSVLPDIAVRSPDIRRPPRLEPDAERRRLFDAIGNALVAMSQARGMLLVVEDVHWAGPATIELLEHVMRVAATVRILVLVTYRDDELRDETRRTFRRIEEHRLATRAPLGQLERDAVAALARYACVAAGNDFGAITDNLYAISGGNALFVTEALQSYDAGKFDLATAATLQEVIEMRLARLPENARAFAAAASVLTAGFEVDVARDVCGWSESDALAALDGLLEHRIVRTAMSHGRTAFTFSHELVQSVFYRSNPDAARRLAHRRAARALARAHPDRLDEIAAERAMHLERANLAVEAAQEYLRAARRAGAVFANREILDYTARGLPFAADAVTRFELLAIREQTHVRCGDWLEAIADLNALERCAEEIGEDALFEVLRRHVDALHRAGDMDEAAHTIEALTDLAEKIGDERRSAEAKLAAATHVRLQGRTKESIAALQAALAAYRAIADRRNEALILGQLAEMSALAGEAEAADAFIVRAREIAENPRDKGLVATVLGYAARTAHHLRRYLQLQAVGLELLGAARDIGDVAAEAQALTSYANACVALFDLDRAEEYYVLAADLHRRSDNRLGSAVVAANRGALRGRVAAWTEARELSDEARTAFAALGDLPREISATFNEAQMCVELDDATAGLAFARRAFTLAEAHGGAPLQAAALGLVGICERHLGHLDDAVEHLEHSIARSRDLPNATEQLSMLAELTLAYVERGDVAAALRNAETLEACAGERSVLDSLSHPQLVPWAASRAYALAGEVERSQAALTSARELTTQRLASIANETWRTAYRDWALNESILE